jgi:hypothetical protein
VQGSILALRAIQIQVGNRFQDNWNRDFLRGSLYPLLLDYMAIGAAAGSVNISPLAIVRSPPVTEAFIPATIALGPVSLTSCYDRKLNAVQAFGVEASRHGILYGLHSLSVLKT